MTKNVVNTDGKIIIYTDGSFNHETCTTGSAYVVESQGEDDHYVTSYQEYIGPKMRSGSLYAEIMAITYALEDMPKNSNIVIKTDEINLSKFGNKSATNRNVTISTMQDSRVQKALQKLSNSIDRHDTITTEHVSHRKAISYQEKRMMNMVHNAAGEQANVKTRKHVPHRNKETGTARTSPRRDFAESIRNHNTDESNRVIDLKEEDPNIPFEYPSGTNDPQP